jgi:OOP family OmpA-OmpF porin
MRSYRFSVAPSRLGGVLMCLLMNWTVVYAQEKPKSKWDFIPGERQLFFDDFSDMEDGDSPLHWKARGSAVGLRRKEDARQLVITKGDTKLEVNLKGLPKNFTIESDLAFGPGTQHTTLVQLYLGNAAETKLKVTLQVRGEKQGDGLLIASNIREELGNVSFPFDLGEPLFLNFWMQEGRLRVYVNRDRLVDANQIDLGNVDRLWLEFQPYDGPIVISRFRVAESAPEFGRTIMNNGRYVTHGIHFALDSDQLKPESAPVLKMVAAGMTTNPPLKLLIEGHTDSSGDAKHNLDLSERRAAAVKNALVSQYGIAADRLTTAGLGATKPAGSNETAEGRFSNRRVEFVKQ